MASVLDQDATHGLGSRSEEMSAILPSGVPLPYEPQIRLVDQGGRLERLPGPLLRHPQSDQLAQLLVDQR
jgi:hypothetical protein